MNNLINILSKDGQLVVTSRQVAEDFEKEHKNIIRDIEHLLNVDGSKLSNAYFIESEYTNSNNRAFKEYLLTRDGFSLLVMGFTGSKALEWKLKYIEAFNKMEQTLKEQKPTCIEDVLIQSLKEMKDIKQQLSQVNSSALEANKKAEETKEEVQAIREVVALNANAWRKDTSALINKMALNLGGYEQIKPLREESYKLLEQRMGVQLSIRLTNKRRRMADEGVCKSKRDKLNKVDVITDDKKLIEGYMAIIKEMAIKYRVA